MKAKFRFCQALNLLLFSDLEKLIFYLIYEIEQNNQASIQLLLQLLEDEEC